MLTRLTEAEWKIVLMVFWGRLPRRGNKAWDARRILEALYFVTLQNVSWKVN